MRIAESKPGEVNGSLFFHARVDDQVAELLHSIRPGTYTDLES
jgi:hypothetical protein